MEILERDLACWDEDQLNVCVFLPGVMGEGVSWHVRYLSEAAMMVHLVSIMGPLPVVSFPTSFPQCLVRHESLTFEEKLALARGCDFTIIYEQNNLLDSINNLILLDGGHYVARMVFLEKIKEIIFTAGSNKNKQKFLGGPGALLSRRAPGRRRQIIIFRRNIGDRWTTINDWFIWGFRELGHTVIPVNIPYLGAHTYNPLPSVTMTHHYRLMKMIERYEADTLFIIHGGGYWTKEMIEDSQARGLKVVYFNPDDPMLFKPVSCFIAPFCDLVLVFPKVVELYKRELGIEAQPFFYCIDPAVEKGPVPDKKEKERYQTDILMTGVINSARKKTRGEMLSRLSGSGAGKVAFYGPKTVDLPEDLKSIYRGEIVDNRVHNLILRSAKIIFHYTQELLPEEAGAYMLDGFQSVSGRLLEGAAAGSLVMTNYFVDLEKAFCIGKEIVVYESIEDAIEKAGFYLRNDDKRMAIAAAGQKRAMNEHRAIDRARFILECLEKGENGK